VIGILWIIKNTLMENLKVTKEMNEQIQRGLHKEIMQNIEEQFQGEMGALLMKHKINKARREAGEAELE
jgi:hypothetical protein